MPPDDGDASRLDPTMANAGALPLPLPAAVALLVPPVGLPPCSMLSSSWEKANAASNAIDARRCCFTLLAVLEVADEDDEGVCCSHGGGEEEGDMSRDPMPVVAIG